MSYRTEHETNQIIAGGSVKAIHCGDGSRDNAPLPEGVSSSYLQYAQLSTTFRYCIAVVGIFVVKDDRLVFKSGETGQLQLTVRWRDSLEKIERLSRHPARQIERGQESQKRLARAENGKKGRILQQTEIPRSFMTRILFSSNDLCAICARTVSPLPNHANT